MVVARVAAVAEEVHKAPQARRQPVVLLRPLLLELHRLEVVVVAVEDKALLYRHCREHRLQLERAVVVAVGMALDNR